MKLTSTHLLTACFLAAKLCASNPVPEPHGLTERQSAYDEWAPGQFDILPNDNSNFIRVGSSGYAFNSIGGFAGGNSQGVANAYTAGSCVRGYSCELLFRSDGNLVILKNGAVSWNSNTAGRGAAFRLYDGSPWGVVVDSGGNYLWGFPQPPPPCGGPMCP